MVFATNAGKTTNQSAAHPTCRTFVVFPTFVAVHIHGLGGGSCPPMVFATNAGHEVRLARRDGSEAAITTNVKNNEWLRTSLLPCGFKDRCSGRIFHLQFFT
jgi:hypothetical protein